MFQMQFNRTDEDMTTPSGISRTSTEYMMFSQEVSTLESLGTDPMAGNDENIEETFSLFDICQQACTTVGFFANVLTLIVLLRHPGRLSRMILILLRHQSLVDSWVCLLASTIILQPYMWLTGNTALDFFICHAWHSQAFYWGAVCLSTYNLMAISWERYLAVCRPFKHGNWDKLSLQAYAWWFAGLYAMSLVFMHGVYVQTRMRNGHCVSENAIDGQTGETFLFAYVIFIYLTTYFIPVTFMGTLAFLITRQLRKHSKGGIYGKAISKASAQLVKTTIAVATIFAVSLGYDLHYYLLGYTHVTEYKFNTATQKIGVFLTNVNSCANPFVYALLMPMFRRSILRTFCCCKHGKELLYTNTDQTVKSSDSEATREKY